MASIRFYRCEVRGTQMAHWNPNEPSGGRDPGITFRLASQPPRTEGGLGGHYWTKLHPGSHHPGAAGQVEAAYARYVAMIAAGAPEAEGESCVVYC